MNSETWQRLLRPALRIVDSLADLGYRGAEFRLGGGTVLALRFDHRLSNDIDLFVDDAQALGFLSPRLNDTAAATAADYQEQANSIKLRLAGGDIDFIVAGTVTRAPPLDMEFEGRLIRVEATAEIVAKKLLYRAGGLKPRDAFDLGVALALDRPAAMVALAATRRTHPVLLRRLQSWLHDDRGRLWDDVQVTASGRSHLPGLLGTVTDAIREIDHHG